MHPAKPFVASKIAAFASVALQFPDLAVQQIEYAVKKLGMRGAAVGGDLGAQIAHATNETLVLVRARNATAKSKSAAIPGLRALEAQGRKTPPVVMLTGGARAAYQAKAVLESNGVPTNDIVGNSELATNSANAGGGRISRGEQSYVIRGIGQIHSLDDLGAVAVRQNNGTPVLVRGGHDIGIAGVDNATGSQEDDNQVYFPPGGDDDSGLY